MSKKHFDIRFLRITSGEARSRKIETPENTVTHPMGDRERLALFNSIQPIIRGATVLDLYAGSGSLGLEALSRGAKNAIFVEKDAKAVACILKNAKELGYESRATVLQGDVHTALRTGGLSEDIFDIILCDPPYNHFDLDEFKSATKYLEMGGVLVLSHPDMDAPEFFDLKLTDTKKFAGANLSFYEKA